VAIELECKVRVASLVAPREKLRATGARFVGRVLEENRLFDRPDEALRRAGCGLRVRTARALEDEGGKAVGQGLRSAAEGGCAATLTYKGPRVPGAFKQREEIEVEIGDAEAMGGILRALGYVERIMFEKRRESWLLGSCRVELDELPELGTFVEVEGPNEASIRAALAAIGLEALPSISESYVGMAARLLETQPGRGRELRFASEPKAD
jgi:adenylate cyclase, class 2